MARYLYSELANTICARRNCLRVTPPNQEWFEKHTDKLEALVKEHMPSGSGFDAGTTLNLDESHAEKLVFNTSFHHMNESGYYDGWTEHTVTITPSFIGGFNMRISGRNRNQIKEYIGDTFYHALKQEVE